MATIALMTVSDGRASVHQGIAAFAAASEERIAAALTERGHSIVRARELLWTNELAVARGAAARRCARPT